MHAQMVITEDDLKQLKDKTGEKNTKDALAKAVEHYLACPKAGLEPDKMTDEERRKKLEKRMLTHK